MLRMTISRGCAAVTSIPTARTSASDMLSRMLKAVAEVKVRVQYARSSSHSHSVDSGQSCLMESDSRVYVGFGIPHQGQALRPRAMLYIATSRAFPPTVSRIASSRAVTVILEHAKQTDRSSLSTVSTKPI